MSIDFRGVNQSPLQDLTVSAPSHAIIGIAGVEGSGQTTLLRLAAGVEQPQGGTVEAPPTRRFLKPGDALDFSPVDLLAMDGALSGRDPITVEQARFSLEQLRRSGATILFGSHDELLLARLCDEIWWLDQGRIAAKGDPRDVYPKYNRFVSDQLIAWGASQSSPLDLSSRRGDSRAEIVTLETIGQGGTPSLVLRNHEPAIVRVNVRFTQPVEKPVIGILIRTRVGFEVYGTNTELERVEIGPCAAGDQIRVDFRFACNLCPGEYTLTAASHDASGTAHDWLDDAIAFSVSADRYTAGVADLRAAATIERVRLP